MEGYIVVLQCDAVSGLRQRQCCSRAFREAAALLGLVLRLSGVLNAACVF